jgi:hypothetical protein
MQNVAIKMQCQCGSNQGDCQCGSALKIYLENNVCSYWIQKPNSEGDTILDVYGLVATQHPMKPNKWIIRYNSFSKVVVAQEFDSAEEAAAHGLEWIKSQQETVH